VVDSVNFKETGFFICIGIAGTDRDLLFQEISRFGAGFPLEGEFFLVRFQLPVDSRRAGGEEQFPDFLGDAKWLLQMFHLFPDEGGKNFLAPVPEEGPDVSQSSDKLAGVDGLPASAFFTLAHRRLKPDGFSG
jgi:hypothetical protein